MTIFAILLAALALVSGLYVVGCGKHFDYTVNDILKGRENALLYIWVTCSTMISAVHLTMLYEFGRAYEFGPKDDETLKWMLIHSAFSGLFISAHFIVKKVLVRNEGKAPRYLWGATARA